MGWVRRAEIRAVGRGAGWIDPLRCALRVGHCGGGLRHRCASTMKEARKACFLRMDRSAVEHARSGEQPCEESGSKSRLTHGVPCLAGKSYHQGHPHRPGEPKRSVVTPEIMQQRLNAYALTA